MNSRSSLPTPVLEIGGTHVTAALVSLEATNGPAVVVKHRDELDAAGTADDVLGSFSKAAHRLDGASTLSTWVVAIPGPFDYDRGVGQFTGVGKFESLNGVDIGERLLGALRPQVRTIRFVNDATAFGLGECAAGAGRDHERVVCLTLGTGVGSVFVDQGRAVDSGDLVPPRGWAYLLQWNGRPLENTVSRRALQAAYHAETGEYVEVLEIAVRARDGQRIAQRTLRRAMSALGQAIGPWARRFGASAVLVGGSIAGSWDLIAGPLHAALRETSRMDHLDLIPAQLGDDASLIGAALAATPSAVS